MSNMLQAALDLAKAKWPVFPCIESGDKAKAPRTPHGLKDATTDLERITRWWTQWPNALVAIALPAHLLAFDIDIRHGGSHESLEAVTGPLPRTLTAWSGRNDGGCHLYFFKPEREISQRQLPKGVDLRTGGKHYLIAPPSLHPSTGKPYVWQHAPIAELPSQAVEALAPRKPSVKLPAPVSEHSGNLDGLVRTVAQAVEGERNAKLFWAACRVFEGGHTGIVQDLFEAALSVGLPASEAAATITSANRIIGGAAA